MNEIELKNTGRVMSDFDKKLDRILDNQIKQGQSIVRIETYQSTYKEDLNEVKKKQDIIDVDINKIHAKMNKAIGVFAVITFLAPFVIKFFGGK